MFAELLERLALALDAAGLPYMIIGGQAVLLHGEPRLTQDVDITLAADLDRLDDVLLMARGQRLEPLVDPAEFTRGTMVLPCRDLTTGIRIDFIFSFSPYERECIARSIAVPIGRAQVRFATASDLVVHKVLAGRARDLEDARSVLLKNSEIDRDRVRAVLSEFEKGLDRGTELTERFDALSDDVAEDAG